VRERYHLRRIGRNPLHVVKKDGAGELSAEILAGCYGPVKSAPSPWQDEQIVNEVEQYVSIHRNASDRSELAADHEQPEADRQSRYIRFAP